jgi:myosin protein heavy chain
VQQQLASTASEKDALSQEKSSLQSEFTSAQKAFSQLNEKLLQVTSELAAGGRQLQTTQNELKAATRRAEDAEKTQKDLQAEGTTLMRSLDEMRPKIVELTGVKLELGEKVDGLEHTLRSRDTIIGQLEADLDELRDQKEQADQRLQEILAQREKDRSLAQASSGELQKAYADLREELDLSNDSVRSLEVERANHRQESVKRLEEIDRLTAASNAQQDELSALRQELAERLTDQDEEQDFLARAQNEIESLRLDLTAKDEELERLREAVSSPTKDDPHSLDHELLSSLRQQHALDLSAAQSQIRARENSVFDAEAKSHALRKQLSTLEDQLAQTRGAVAHRALSPSIPSTSRPASRAASVRTGLGAGAPSLARSVFDQNLTPETRHKRKVSLSMLKARIDSEVAAHALAHQHSRPSSRALSPVQSVDGDARPTSPPLRAPAPFHRPQFLDDSHVFWCHSCRGDLVIL